MMSSSNPSPGTNASPAKGKARRFRPSPLLYGIAKAILFVLHSLYFRASARGGHNMPAEGPVLVVSNHTSFLDPTLVGTFLPRRLAYMARASLFLPGPVGWTLGAVGSIPVDRGKGDRAAIRTCLEVLREGNALLIFPEGTRSRDGKMLPAETGAALILNQLPDVPVLPVRIEGAHRALGRGMIFPRPRKINIIVGKPFRISDLKPLPEVKKQLYHELGAEILRRIATASP